VFGIRGKSFFPGGKDGLHWASKILGVAGFALTWIQALFSKIKNLSTPIMTGRTSLVRDFGTQHIQMGSLAGAARM